MASRKPTRQELERRFKREDYPNEEAWLATISAYMKSSGTCVGCEHFASGPFEWDCVGFDGVCMKHKQVVSNSLCYPCPDEFGNMEEPEPTFTLSELEVVMKEMEDTPGLSSRFEFPDGAVYDTDTGYAMEGVAIFMERLALSAGSPKRYGAKRKVR